MQGRMGRVKDVEIIIIIIIIIINLAENHMVEEWVREAWTQHNKEGSGWTLW